jgi:dipeptidyl-peptidase-4
MKKQLLLLILFISSTLFAQQKNFTMQEAVLGLGSTLAVKNIKQLKWMGSSEKYAQAISTDNFKGFVATNPANGNVDTMITLERINEISNLKLKSLPAVEWVNHQAFYFMNENALYQISNSRYEPLRKLAYNKEAENLFFEPTKTQLAYTVNNNIYIQNVAGIEKQITTDGTKNIVYGTTVHQSEFGIDHGLFWSPKGNALAFYRMDQTAVTEYPVVNWSDTPATVKMVKYPFAGNTSHQVTLGVYHINTGKTIYLKTGEPKEQYLTNVTWSPDEKYIYINLVNRAQNHTWLNKYNASTGEFIKTLFEEKNEKYVEPQHPLYFVDDHANEFIYWSQRDGYTHLYLYNSEGKLMKQLTKGAWIVNEILGYNKKLNKIVFTSSKESPLQKNIYTVNIETGKIDKKSSVDATHTATLSANGNYLLDNYTNQHIPRNINLVNVHTGDTTNILSAPNPLVDYQTANVELKELKADDGTVLYSKIIYPIDFDESKSYPAIVYLYNGPHVQLNKDAFPFSGNLWYDYMAQKGYFVFVLDGRGSANRGFEFESIIHRQLGTIEMQDQLVGINYLKSLPYIDTNRLGIHGWSFGGFMTTSFMLRNPGIFKAAVAGGPVLDWSMYEIMYGERYMDTPKENPEGYSTSLLFNKIKNLQGKLLLIHGTDDATVVWQHSLRFLKQAVSDNVQVDYFVYPGYEHNVRGKDRVHLMQKISDYFDENLK